MNTLGSWHTDFDNLRSLLSDTVAETWQGEKQKPIPAVKALRDIIEESSIDYEYFAESIVQDVPELLSQVGTANKRVDQLYTILKDGAQQLARDARIRRIGSRASCR